MAIQVTNQLILNAAKNRGWTARIIDEKSGIIGVTPAGQAEIRLKSSADPRADILAYFIAARKDLFYRLGTQEDLPVPISIEYEDDVTAQHFLEQHETLVVKPNDAAHGNGVSMSVTTPESLKRAIERANEFSETVLIQKQYFGNDYRVLVIGNEVVAATHRRPAFVVGDGQHTVEQLIRLENESDARAEGYTEKMCLINEAGARRFLGEKMHDVPASGEECTVLDVPNIGQGGASINVTNTVSDYVRGIAVKAAQMAGLRVAGVDILAEDLSVDSGDNLALIEINAVPSFGMHQLPNIGKPIDVASLFLDEISRQ